MGVAYQSGSSLSSGTRTNSTVTAPSGITDGDLLIYVLSIGGAAGPTASPPSGFAALTNFPIAYSQPDPWTVRVYAWSKVASSESGNYTATHSSASTEAFMARIDGQAATPINPDPQKTEDSTTPPSETTLTAPTITPAVDESLVIAVYGSWNAIGPSSPPTGTTPTFTERYDGTVLYVADGVLATAGATGAKVLDVPGEHPAWGAALICVEAQAFATYEQEGYRFRNDDGSESAATWKAAQDTSVSLAVDDVARLRVLTDTANVDPPSSGVRLQWKKVGEDQPFRDVAP